MPYIPFKSVSQNLETLSHNYMVFILSILNICTYTAIFYSLLISTLQPNIWMVLLIYDNLSLYLKLLEDLNVASLINKYVPLNTKVQNWDVTDVGIRQIIHQKPCFGHKPDNENNQLVLIFLNWIIAVTSTLNDRYTDSTISALFC